MKKSISFEFFKLIYPFEGKAEIIGLGWPIICLPLGSLRVLFNWVMQFSVGATSLEFFREIFFVCFSDFALDLATIPFLDKGSRTLLLITGFLTSFGFVEAVFF